MKHLAQLLGPPLVEGGTDLLGPRRALAQSLFEAPLVEALYGGARRLGVAAPRAGGPVGVFASGAGEQDLTTAGGGNGLRAQTGPPNPALRGPERAHEEKASPSHHPDNFLS